MKRLFWTSSILLLLAAVGAANARETLEGRWKAERDGGKAWLQIKYSDGRGHTQMSFDVRPEELRDLGGDRFALDRDAGTFEFSGDTSGSYVFTGNADFVRELERRGYGKPDLRDLFELASLDLALAFIDEMEAVGYGGDLRQLTEFRIHGVDAELVRELAELGYSELPGRNLVEMRIHGVKPQFIREMAALGYDDLAVRQLVEMRIHGVDPDDVRDFVGLGLDDLSARQLVEMRIHGVSPSFVREMGELGYSDLDARQWVEMRIHGVSPSFVRKLAEKGYTGLSARELVEMRIHGVPRRHGRS